MSEQTTCALCGLDPAQGFASVTQDDTTVRLCHGEAPHSPGGTAMTCYHLWTVYGVRGDECHVVDVAVLVAALFGDGDVPYRNPQMAPPFTHTISLAPKVDPIWGRNRMYPEPSFTMVES